jgi:hypothetical protein
MLQFFIVVTITIGGGEKKNVKIAMRRYGEKKSKRFLITNFIEKFTTQFVLITDRTLNLNLQ